MTRMRRGTPRTLLDSPAALAAWLLDHDTDSYSKISRAFAGGQPSGGPTACTGKRVPTEQNRGAGCQRRELSRLAGS